MGNTMKTPRASAEGGEETNGASQTGKDSFNFFQEQKGVQNI